MAEPAVAVAALRRDYGERTALRDVSFEIEPGETLAVVGPNGAGKSTLLRILATLLRPSGGDVALFGSRLPGDAWRARRRGIGYLGHEPLLYRELTLRENLRFHARLHGLPVEAIDATIDRLLGIVGLADRVHEQVRDLSAGMVQRAAVCRSVLHDPELLLLDEPTSHVDPGSAGQIDELLRGSAQVARVIVTHDLDRGLAAADRVLALTTRGEPAYLGPVDGFEPGSVFG